LHSSARAKGATDDATDRIARVGFVASLACAAFCVAACGASTTETEASDSGSGGTLGTETGTTDATVLAPSDDGGAGLDAAASDAARAVDAPATDAPQGDGAPDAAAPPAGPAPPASGTADIWLTTSDLKNLLTKQTPIALQTAGADAGTTIDVDVTQTFQTIDGFGAAMTDSSAYVLTNDMSATQRTDLMSKLFDPVAGIGLSYLRVPMGASDFTSVGSYTYDDLTSGTDTALAHFSIAHDKAYILPRLIDALAINPALKMMATPWSPPAWMKTNGSLNGGSLNSTYYPAYAQYFVKFIQAYQATGVPISLVTPQNEPQNASATIPSMSFTAADEATFVATALGPAFADAGITAKIVVYDHNWQDQFSGQAATYPQTVYANAQAAAYIAGSAFHGYSGDVSAQMAVHQANPDKDIYFTEYLAGDGEDLETTFQDIMVGKVIGATQNWSRNSVLWNIVLDENDGPQNNGCTDCRGVVTVNSGSGAVTFNPEYYLLGHMSKFVFGGAKRVSSNAIGSITNVAFVNPNGTRALVAMNTGSGAVSFRVRTSAHEFSYSLPAGATGTFVWAD
jgi:glucosylceramidase